MRKRSLFTKREYYKPFDFPWAYEAFVHSEQMHWLAREVPLNEDVRDWKVVLSPAEKNLLTQIFRFFTQADVDVAGGYIDHYLPSFKPIELRMMMASIAAREAVHIQAYSMLIDEIGMPETEYAAFLEYAEMKEKHEFLFKREKGVFFRDLALNIAIFSAFGEGLQLFASFVMLLNFTRFGKMKGMGQIVSWSIRDETHHVDSMIKVYHALLEERPEVANSDSLGDEINATCAKMVELEDKFIDLAFAQGGIEGLTPDEVKGYIRYIADVRLQQLGLPPLFKIGSNPLPWVDVIVFGKEHTNFFENRATDYSKGTVEGSWEDAFDDQ
jgi:ribonucleoside-diphosphate reductase beta chain